jgi:HEAT repeat protein
MSAIDKIAYSLNRRDEVPNQELARQLAEAEDRAGIREIAANLWNKNKNIRSDCLKVLYEIGYINPDLIADYVDDFLKLLQDKNNRLIWGAMIGLGTIADRRAANVWAHVDEVMAAVAQGSVITVVWGVRALAGVAAADKKYRKKIFPFLMSQLQTCIPRDVPTHAESVLRAVDKRNRQEFLDLLEARRPELTPAQLTRLKQVMKKLPG